MYGHPFETPPKRTSGISSKDGKGRDNMHFYGTGKVNDAGHLEIGGVDTVQLAAEYGTPLYVYDIELIRERARGFKQTFENLGILLKSHMQAKHFLQSR